jgi:hypothetical protein
MSLHLPLLTWKVMEAPHTPSMLTPHSLPAAVRRSLQQQQQQHVSVQSIMAHLLHCWASLVVFLYDDAR